MIFSKIILAMFFISALPLKLSAATQSQGLMVQFTGNDLTSMKEAVQDLLARQPISGISLTPIRSPYSFGTIIARDINYEFYPNLIQMELLSNGMKFQVEINQFQSRIGRLDLNESGSMYCVGIKVHSVTKPIPVEVVVRPIILADGTLNLEVVDSQVLLNNENFAVDYPSECDVAFGFDWLIRWTLPAVIESFKGSISTAMAQSLAKSLSERAVEASPLLSLNLTLPFDPISTPAFYANIDIKPYNVSIQPDRIQSTFATSINIDPDSTSPFREPVEWPNYLSLFGISWDFLDGLFQEAQLKGVIQSTIKPGFHSGLDWIQVQKWTKIWPKFSSVLAPSESLNLKILGGKHYKWHNFDGPESESRLRNSALLDISDFKVQLQGVASDGRVRTLAEMNANVTMNFQFGSSDAGNLNGSLTSFQLANAKIFTSGGPLDGLEQSGDGIKKVIQELQSDIVNSTTKSRQIFSVHIPSLKIGSHQISIHEIKTHEAGVILPLRYVFQE